MMLKKCSLVALVLLGVFAQQLFGMQRLRLALAVQPNDDDDTSTTEDTPAPSSSRISSRLNEALKQAAQIKQDPVAQTVAQALILALRNSSRDTIDTTKPITIKELNGPGVVMVRFEYFDYQDQPNFNLLEALNRAELCEDDDDFSVDSDDREEIPFPFFIYLEIIEWSTLTSLDFLQDPELEKINGADILRNALLSIKISHCPIAVFDASAFAGYKKLTHIDMSDNIIEQLFCNDSIPFPLANLWSLDLSNNKIRSLGGFFFNDFYRLHTLSLRNNHIRRFGEYCFLGLTAQRKILFDPNTPIHEKAFKTLNRSVHSAPTKPKKSTRIRIDESKNVEYPFDDHERFVPIFDVQGHLIGYQEAPFLWSLDYAADGSPALHPNGKPKESRKPAPSTFTDPVKGTWIYNPIDRGYIPVDPSV